MSASSYSRSSRSWMISMWSSPRNPQDRKSTRLNSSHGYTSYAVFCLIKIPHGKRGLGSSVVHGDPTRMIPMDHVIAPPAVPQRLQRKQVFEYIAPDRLVRVINIAKAW